MATITIHMTARRSERSDLRSASCKSPIAGQFTGRRNERRRHCSRSEPHCSNAEADDRRTGACADVTVVHDSADCGRFRRRVSFVSIYNSMSARRREIAIHARAGSPASNSSFGNSARIHYPLCGRRPGRVFVCGHGTGLRLGADCRESDRFDHQSRWHFRPTSWSFSHAIPARSAVGYFAGADRLSNRRRGLPQ